MLELEAYILHFELFAALGNIARDTTSHVSWMEHESAYQSSVADLQIGTTLHSQLESQAQEVQEALACTERAFPTTHFAQCSFDESE